MKILYIGAYGYGQGYKGLGDAFKKAGWDVYFYPHLKEAWQCGLRFIGADRYQSMASSMDIGLLDNYLSEVGSHPMNWHLLSLVKEYQPDVLFTHSGQRIGTDVIRKIRDEGVFTIYYTWDDPYAVTYSKLKGHFLELACQHNMVLTSSADSVALYEENGAECVKVLHPGFSPEVHKPISLSGPEGAFYACDVSFVATNTYPKDVYPCAHFERMKLIDTILKASGGEIDVALWGPGDVHCGWLDATHSKPDLFKKYYRGLLAYDDLSNVFSSSAINLNSNAVTGRRYYNERTFIVLGSRGFLLTESTGGIEQDFTVGRELDVYASYDELADKVRFYLKNKTLRKKIAARGYAKALTFHTWQKRVETLETLLPKRISQVFIEGKGK